MKAALNGVPSLSVLDGWWIEGHIEGITGWSIGENEGRMGETTIPLKMPRSCTKNWNTWLFLFSIKNRIGLLT